MTANGQGVPGKAVPDDTGKVAQVALSELNSISEASPVEASRAFAAVADELLRKMNGNAPNGNGGGTRSSSKVLIYILLAIFGSAGSGYLAMQEAISRAATVEQVDSKLDKHGKAPVPHPALDASIRELRAEQKASRETQIRIEEQTKQTGRDVVDIKEDIRRLRPR